MADRRRWGRAIVVLVPFLWLTLFFLVPFAIVLKISVSELAEGAPPYLPQLDWSAGLAGLRSFFSALTLENFREIAETDIYVGAFLRSLWMAGLATLILFVIGYPIAYGMARAPRRLQPVLVLLVVLPFLSSQLIRIYAWMYILHTSGPLNAMLMGLGLTRAPLVMRDSDGAIMLGLVYSYLPFMVLPLYASLERMDRALIEAAADLGCPPRQAFWRVTFPLSMPGVIAGALLCFIPIVGEVVIPERLGGSGAQMIGQALWSSYEVNWPLAAALAMMMLVVLVGPIMIWQRVEARQDGSR